MLSRSELNANPSSSPLPMEPSLENRLPEATSLPDGFVEVSSDLPAAPSEVVEVEPPEGSGGAAIAEAGEATGGQGPPVSDPDGGSVECDGDADGSTCSAAVEALGGAMPQSGDTSSCGSRCETKGHGGIGPKKGTEISSELYTSDVKEVSALSENKDSSADCASSKKADVPDTKHKAVKRGTKLEKELLELTLKYKMVASERDAAIAVREKLESLCRELQRQNKMLLGECQRICTEGQNMRSDLSSKFTNAIEEVSSKLEQQKVECLIQFKENEMLREKIKHLSDQYALSEQQFTQKLKQKTLEVQLSDLKLQQHLEKSVQEQSQMQVYAEQVKQLLESERSLRLQVAADGEKFQQFQGALLKSNEVFETFKQEIDKMAKLTKDLKKENAFLKGKCEKSDLSLIKLVEEREATRKQMEKLKNQKEKLESLCRSLQAERKQKSFGGNETDSTSVDARTEISVEET